VAEYCYVMKGLTKTVPGGKEVLSNIWLSFFPGAKIGVIGPNGAGKSTLLKIMAGVETEFEGEAWPAKGLTSATCRRSRSWTRPTVRENVLEGLGEIAAAGAEVQRARGQARRAARRRRDAARLRGDGRGPGRHRRGRRVGPRPHHRDRDGRPARPGRRRPDDAVRRGEAPRGAGPAAAVQARHPAAGRADQPPRCGVGRLAAAHAQRLRRDGRLDHPRPLLPRRGGGVDPGARPRQGLPVPGQLLGLARAEARAAAPGGARGVRAAAPARRGGRLGQAVAAGPTDQGQGARPGLRDPAQRERPKQVTKPRS
jgi:energy-coupling factor transporter ATP-binding protein EcfA2